jgi:hypothetical protein
VAGVGRTGVDKPSQSALGVVRPPPKGQKTKKQKKKQKVWGVAGPPPWPIWGGSSTPVDEPPPKGQKNKKQENVWVLGDHP